MLLIHVEVSWSRLQGTSAWANSNPEGLVMTCILPMALYDDGSWLRDSDIWSLCYGLYSAPDFVPSCFIACIGNSFLRHMDVNVCFT